MTKATLTANTMIDTVQSSSARRSWAKFSRATRFILFLVTLHWAMSLATGLAADVSQRGELLTKEGSVNYTKPPAAAVTAPVGQQLNYGDRLRTLEVSRATVRLADRTECRMRELTTLEILPPADKRERPVLGLLRGALYFFSRDKAREAEIITPHATGGPKGTEFAILVEENQTTLILYDGSATLANNQGNVTLDKGEVGIAVAGQAPFKQRIEAFNVVQWWLFYPGVLDAGEIGLTPAEQAVLAASLAAYRQGDIAQALQSYPAGRAPPSDAERIYYAGLLFAAGEVGQSETQLGQLTAPSPLAGALRTAIAAVTLGPPPPAVMPRTASEWLALSYLYQSRFELNDALGAAALAVKASPDFAFAWERLAELEFSFGRVPASMRALNEALRLAPRNAQASALKGFLLSAQNRITEATNVFEQAIALDSALGNAWLGRGLNRIRRGDAARGRADLQTAAILEPNRSLLRSYLGKAYTDAGEEELARRELELARSLDAKEPTPWLYSALLNRQENRVNEAVGDLEQSLALNDNRRLYRSRLLLDQDRAVRSASLAKVYQGAGMTDVSVREATRAVTADYANYSAHLFLADSLNALIDPNGFNLRFQSAYINELLLANLLAPVGAGTLSQQISQQEYSRLFERDRLGLNTTTEYRSDGRFREMASQFGTFGNTGYALDLDYARNEGIRPNNRLSNIDWYAKIKHQFTPQDSVLLLTEYFDFDSGDNFQRYDPTQFNPGFRFTESQQPNVIAAYHREWQPGVHTLLLAGRLVNDQRITDATNRTLVYTTNLAGQITASALRGFTGLDYQNEFETFTTELNHIVQKEHHTTVAGARYQNGQFTTRNVLAGLPAGVAPFFFSPPASARFTEDFDRITAYGYHTWELFSDFLLTGGLAYDRMEYPDNFRFVPITPGQTKREKLSPKLALTWSPAANVTLRGIYSQALGGVSFDESFRLEPTQLAGFNQAFRTLISESEVGSLAGPEYEITGAALDLKLKSRTYLGLQAQVLRSDVDQTVGAFFYSGLGAPPPQISAGPVAEQLRYEEQSVTATLNQLLGDEWSVGAQYRFTHSVLDSRYPGIPAGRRRPRENPHERATLHQAGAFVVFNHPCGFFARADASWYSQHNAGYATPRPGDDFTQVNLLTGWRFLKLRGEFTFGVLNVGGGDYRLNPLNIYNDLPRERVWLTRLRLNF